MVIIERNRGSPATDSSEGAIFGIRRFLLLQKAHATKQTYLLLNNIPISPSKTD